VEYNFPFLKVYIFVQCCAKSFGVVGSISLLAKCVLRTEGEVGDAKIYENFSLMYLTSF